MRCTTATTTTLVVKREEIIMAKVYRAEDMTGKNATVRLKRLEDFVLKYQLVLTVASVMGTYLLWALAAACALKYLFS